MKNKIHLFYGIIIGFLLCACLGASNNKSFGEQHVEWCSIPKAHEKINKLQDSGFTVIEVDAFGWVEDNPWCLIHFGK